MISALTTEPRNGHSAAVASRAPKQIATSTAPSYRRGLYSRRMSVLSVIRRSTMDRYLISTAVTLGLKLFARTLLQMEGSR